MVSFTTKLSLDGKIFVVPSSAPTSKEEALVSLEALKLYEITGTAVKLDPAYIDILEKLINS